MVILHQVHAEEAKSRGQTSVGKLGLYEILYILNQGFEQVLGQLQQLEKLGLMSELSIFPRPTLKLSNGRILLPRVESLVSLSAL